MISINIVEQRWRYRESEDSHEDRNALDVEIQQSYLSDAPEDSAAGPANTPEYQSTLVGLSAFQIKEVQWYLEKHISEPLETERADQALEILHQHARNIISSLDLATFACKDRSDTSDTTIMLRIRVLPQAQPQHMFWELLENLDLWPQKRPGMVIVVRQQAPQQPTQLPHPSTVETPSDEAGQDKNVNILLLSARSSTERDIPYTLVAEVILNKVRAANATISPGRSRHRLEIVRPATLESLEQHLQTKPPGFFQILHLDVHGVEDANGRKYLRFLRITSHEGRTRFVPHDVDAASVGAILQNHRIHHVVLNACRSANGVGVDSSIAETLLASGIHACVAMSYNVLSASVAAFTDKFYLAILESGVTFANAVMLARRAMRSAPRRQSKLGYGLKFDDSMVPVLHLDRRYYLTGVQYLKDAQIPDQEATIGSRAGIIGRDDDIFKVESMLLLETTPLLITGDLGIGKTYLLRWLAKWWESTELFNKVVYLSSLEGTARLLDKWQEAILPDNSKLEWIQVLEFAKDNRYALIVDEIPDIRFQDQRIDRKGRQDMMRLIKDCTKLKLSLILASRSSNNWMKSSVKLYRLDGLDMLSACQLFSRYLVPEISSDSPEVDRQFTEHIIDLVDFNPSAIALIARQLCPGGRRDTRPWSYGTNSPRQYFLKLLYGERMSLHTVDLSIWHTIKILDLINQFSTALMPILCFGLFWKTARLHDVAVLARLAVSSHQTSSTSGSFDSVSSLDGEIGPESAFEEALKTLQDKGLVREIDVPSQYSDIGDKRYIWIHPLATIAARSTIAWLNMRQPVADQFVKYYAERLQDWPIEDAWYKPIWRPAMQAAQWEFWNISAAALIAFNDDDSQMCISQGQSIAKRLRFLAHGVIRHPSREAVLRVIWEAAQALFLRMEWVFKLPLSRPQDHPRSIILAAQHQIHKLQMRLFELTLLLAGQDYHAGLSGAAEKYELLHRLQAEVQESGAQDLKAAYEMNYGLLIAKVAEGILPKSDRQLEEARTMAPMFNARTEVSDFALHRLTASIGVTNRPAYSVEIEQRIAQNELDEATRLVNKALNSEINEWGNDSANKATLMRYLATINIRQGKGLDAQKHAVAAQIMEEAAKDEVQPIFGKGGLEKKMPNSQERMIQLMDSGKSYAETMVQIAAEFPDSVWIAGSGTQQEEFLDNTPRIFVNGEAWIGPSFGIDFNYGRRVEYFRSDMSREGSGEGGDSIPYLTAQLCNDGEKISIARIKKLSIRCFTRLQDPQNEFILPMENFDLLLCTLQEDGHISTSTRVQARRRRADRAGPLVISWDRGTASEDLQLYFSTLEAGGRLGIYSGGGVIEQPVVEEVVQIEVEVQGDRLEE